MNLEEIRQLFPITNEFIYLNHAGTGPMTTIAERAIDECINIYKKQAEFDIPLYFERIKNAREKVAEIIDANPEEIAFTHNTSEGIYIALINLPLTPGDKIIVMREVFPAVRYVVDYNLPHIEKIYLNFCGKDPVDLIKNHIDKQVRVVVVDYVQFLSGEMINLKRLNEFLKTREIFLIVDGIQAIGATNFSVKDIDIDFLACGAAKWLFGPSGTGFLYVNKRNFNKLKRYHTGWLGADWQNFEKFELTPPLFNDARMFEQGTRNVIGISAFSENCRMLCEIGMNNVEERILKLKKRLRDGLRELGIKVITPEDGPQAGIITIEPEDPRRLYNLLKEHKIIISLRNNCLRFSPHFYNSEEEIETTLRILKENT